jgi:hypothetical protein
MNAGEKPGDSQAVTMAAYAIHKLTCGRASGAVVACNGPTKRDLELARAAVEGNERYIAAAERNRIRTVLAERFKTTLAYPVSGYLVDAVPWAPVLDVLAAAELPQPIVAEPNND